MKRETKKPLDEQRRIVAYLDGLPAKVSALREYQSAWIPSMLDRALWQYSKVNQK
jgi:hypothetical protein